MAKFTPQQLKEKYQALPEDLKDAIFSVDSANIIQSVGKKYNLTIDKIGELADETGLVMLGLTHPKDFIPNLSQRLAVDRETARKIAEGVNAQIFAKVRESLKKVHGVGEEAPKSFSTSDVLPPAIADSSSTPDVSRASGEDGETERQEVLKEIEKDEEKPEERIPEILKGPSAPPEKTPFEAKTEEEIHRNPPQVSEHYSDGDPYREPIK